MKVTLQNGQKLYICDKCYAEVYSLICRKMDGEDYDICSECYEEEVKEEDVGIYKYELTASEVNAGFIPPTSKEGKEQKGGGQ